MTATTLHELHHTTTTTPLRYNYNYSCSTSHYIQQLWVRWPLQPLQPFEQTQLQPPFGQSMDSLCHLWFTTANVSYRFPILKLPPPPCAVLLVVYQRLNENINLNSPWDHFWEGDRARHHVNGDVRIHSPPKIQSHVPVVWWLAKLMNHEQVWLNAVSTIAWFLDIATMVVSKTTTSIIY